MKLNRNTQSLCLCIVLAAAGAVAVAGPQDALIRLGAQTWFTQGSGQWDITGALTPDAGFRSLLEWNDLDSVITILKADLSLGPVVRLRASYGSGDIEGGSNTDTDWRLASDAASPFMLSESVSDTDGETTFFDIDLLILATPQDYFDFEKLRLDVVLGYIAYTDSLTDSDGIQTVIDEAPVYDAFPGVNALYDFDWRAYRAGIDAQYSINRRIQISAAAVLLLDVTHEGRGFWALREDMWREPPNMENDAEGGLGADMALAASYSLAQNFAVELGWRYLYFETKNGTHTSFLADGSAGVTDLDSVTGKRAGLFAGIRGSF